MTLVEWVAESIVQSRRVGYYPTGLEARLRSEIQKHGGNELAGTIKTIEQFVLSGEIKSGFRRLIQLGMPEWTLEEGVRLYPVHFTGHVLECANWRLQQAGVGR